MFIIIIVVTCIFSICRFYVSLSLMLLVCILTYEFVCITFICGFYVSLSFDIVYIYIFIYLLKVGD